MFPFDQIEEGIHRLAVVANEATGAGGSNRPYAGGIANRGFFPRQDDWGVWRRVAAAAPAKIRALYSLPKGEPGSADVKKFRAAFDALRPELVAALRASARRGFPPREATGSDIAELAYDDGPTVLYNELAHTTGGLIWAAVTGRVRERCELDAEGRIRETDVKGDRIRYGGGTPQAKWAQYLSENVLDTHGLLAMYEDAARHVAEHDSPPPPAPPPPKGSFRLRKRRRRKPLPLPEFLERAPESRAVEVSRNAFAGDASTVAMVLGVLWLARR